MWTNSILSGTSAGPGSTELALNDKLRLSLTGGAVFRYAKARLEAQMDEVHLIWYGLVALFVLIGIVLAALKSLPVRPRR
jgi:hypothetical protein